jgi:hypothetical protein
MLPMTGVETLASLGAGGACVLTVYLDLAGARELQRSQLAAFDDLVSAARDRLEQPAQAQLLHEVAPVREWLQRERLKGNTLVVFSSRTTELVAALALAVRIKDYVALGTSADVRPFYDVLDERRNHAGGTRG